MKERERMEEEREGRRRDKVSQSDRDKKSVFVCVR